MSWCHGSVIPSDFPAENIFGLVFHSRISSCKLLRQISSQHTCVVLNLNPAKQILTTTNLDQNPKMKMKKCPDDESEPVPQPGDLRRVDETPKIAQYHHRSLDLRPKTTTDSSPRDVTPSTHCSGDCEGVSVYAEGRSDPRL